MSSVRIVEDNRAAILRQIERRMSRVTAETAQQAKQQMQQAAPRESGELAESIDAEQEALLRWVVFVGALHAVFVEYGSRNRAATPFFWPVVERLRGEYVAAIRVALRDL